MGNPVAKVHSNRFSEQISEVAPPRLRHLSLEAREQLPERNQKLKEAFAQLLEMGMQSSPAAQISAAAPRPVRLRKTRRLTITDIEAAIASGRE